MLNNKYFAAVLLAAATVSTTAMADERGVNTAVGAVIGAAIGHSAGGRNGAIVGGVLGAAVGNSVSTRDDRRYGANVYYDNGYARDSYYRQPAPVYVEPRPVYYERPATYYRQPAVVYVEPRWERHEGRERWEHRHDRGGHRGWHRD